jgi:hypothetical protein
MIFIRFHLRILHLWHAFVYMIRNNEYLHTLKIESMKKLMILSAAALAMFLAMPQISEATTVQNITSVSQTKAVKYTEITAAEIPVAVTATLTKDFVGYAIDNIYQGDDGTFKLAVHKAAVKSVLLFSSKGELIK